MKRSAALRSLSRDHHKALSVAQKMRRADDGPEGAALFCTYWEQHGKVHFRIEEEVLLPSWAQSRHGQSIGCLEADTGAPRDPRGGA